jgi:hypothetical protein
VGIRIFEKVCGTRMALRLYAMLREHKTGEKSLDYSLFINPSSFFNIQNKNFFKVMFEILRAVSFMFKLLLLHATRMIQDGLNIILDSLQPKR